MLPLSPVSLLEYLEPGGRSPFAIWFDGLNAQAAAKVTVALHQITRDNVSNVKSVGAGVMEYRINFGPGYRIYFARDGERIVILLGGGTKQRQQEDIRRAQARWLDYKQRKK